MTDAPDAGPGSAARVLSRDELLRRYGKPREGRLVFTNGVFDLMHAGHLASLEAARSFGESLVVGINTDASTRRLKGPSRPFQPEGDRARLVAGLRCVDAVTLFDEDTPAALIEALLPDVLVKGADYADGEVVGADAVRAAGGEVRLVELLDDRSTTGLAAKIRESG